jgi:hypothetical protein
MANTLDYELSVFSYLVQRGGEGKNRTNLSRCEPEMRSTNKEMINEQGPRRR